MFESPLLDMGCPPRYYSNKITGASHHRNEMRRIYTFFDGLWRHTSAGHLTAPPADDMLPQCPNSAQREGWNVHRTTRGKPTDITSIFRSPLAPTITVWMLILTYCIVFGTLSILQHESFGTSIYDLGNVDQALWNTVHGRLLQFTTQPRMGDVRLSMHIEPILLPLSLSYLIYSDPKTLLGLQTIGLGLGAWPLYLLARWRLRRAWPAVAFAAAYLLLPALEAANLFEFHAVALAPFFLLFAFYAAERTADAGRRSAVFYFGLSIVSALLAMSCKEDIPLLVVTTGLYFAVSRRWKIGVPLIVLGGLWFYAAIYVVFPLVREGKGSPFLHYYKDFGDNPISIAVNLLTHPRLFAETVLTRDNLHYLFGLLFPFGLLPVAGLPAFLMATPALAINLLSSFPLMHELEAKQYPLPIVPFVAIAAVYGTYWLSRWLRRERAVLYSATALLLICAFTYHYLRGFSPLAQPYNPPEVTAHHRLAGRFIAQIPPDAPLIAQDRLFPHVSQRERAYYVWTADTDAEYIFLDVSHPSFVNVDNVHQWLKEKLERQEEFGVVDAQDGYVLLRRGVAPSPLPDDFFSFVHADERDIEHPLQVDFDDTIRLLGYDIIYDRDREVNFVLYWQALRPLNREYSIALYLISPAGEVIQSTTAPQPALVWYPTSRWRPGETIRVTVNTLPWSTKDLAQYGVAVGVASPDGTGGPEMHLQPRVKEASTVTRLLDGGFLVELAWFKKIWGMHQAAHEPRTFTRPDMEHDITANFADLVELRGYTLEPREPGRPLHVQLLWHSLTHIPESYTVFVHLTDSRGKIWGQQDSIPGEGTLPTTAWVPGEYIRDRYTLHSPEQVSGEALRLAIGLYNADTGERLGLIDASGRVHDNSVLVEIP